MGNDYLLLFIAGVLIGVITDKPIYAFLGGFLYGFLREIDKEKGVITS